MTLAETLRRGGLARISLTRRKPTGAAPVGPAPPAAAPRTDAPQLRDWIGVLAMGTGLFMAIMDVQIVTSSLTQIQGGLSASTDEIAWVQTAYLIADVVMVPMCGFMSRLLSTRVLFVIAALGFTGASVLCATATSLGEMIVYRAMQGFCGGAITPTVWPVVYTKFHGRQLASVIAIISVILSLSSTLGPTLGGFLTDTFSWHWLFLVNIVPGLAVAAVVWVTIDIDKPDLSLLRDFDLTGMLLMAAFLGCLEYALHEGPRWDWLDDDTIRVAVFVSVVGGGLFFWRVLTYRQPIVDLRTFLNRNFAFGTFFTFTMGVGMYGTTYLVPLFLAQVRGYNPLQIGLIDRRYRPGHDGDVAGQHPHRTLARSARDVGDRLRPLRLLDVSDGDADQPDRVLGTVRAAGGPRSGTDLLLPAGQHDRDGHVAAGHAEERGRSLQSDPRSRRCNRPGHDCHADERASCIFTGTG